MMINQGIVKLLPQKIRDGNYNHYKKGIHMYNETKLAHV
jgi:hypothetical protein